MDGLDDPENRVKVPDSAYSTSCSNSQSQRSQSSKSTNSSSHSSGSSGYSGKPSTSGSSNKQNQPAEKRSKEKDGKKKSKPSRTDSHAESAPEAEARPQELEPNAKADQLEAKETDVAPAPAPPSHPQPAQPPPECMEIATTECSGPASEEVPAIKGLVTPSQAEQLCTPPQSVNSDGFSCLISMQDGVVMYANSTITSSLGFPKEMWIGRSFIDFIHPKDSNTFASQIMNVIMPKNSSTEPMVEGGSHTMYCRIRSYRNLGNGFGIKHNVMTYLPFCLNLTFKDINEYDGKVVYLLVQATLLHSAYKLPLEPVTKPTPFVTRHLLSRKLQFVDRDSIPYLGYLPQEICDKDALMLYHPDDLAYLLQLYEIVVQKGSAAKSKVYRMQAQNGDYIKLETEFSSFINPWSKKLEFISGRHFVVEGPVNPDVFQLPEGRPTGRKASEDQNAKAQKIRDRMDMLMNETLDSTKQQTSRRCFELTSYMESVSEEPSKLSTELVAEMHDPDNSYYERDSVMLGGISPHHESDFKSSPDTPLSYTMLNYNETLQRYFDSYMAEESDSSDQGKEVVESGGVVEYPIQRLTKPLLIKHNTVMEKELVKRQRKHRLSTSKESREKGLKDNRLKKKEHLNRCKAPFLPATEGYTPQILSHGVKRPCQSDQEEAARKHHSTWAERSRRPGPLAVLAPQPATSSAQQTSQASKISPQAALVAPPLMQMVPQPMEVTSQPMQVPVDTAAMPAHSYGNISASLANQFTVSGMNAYTFSQGHAHIHGAMPSSMPGAMPGSISVTMPGAMPGALPGTMPGIVPGQLPPGALPGIPIYLMPMVASSMPQASQQNVTQPGNATVPYLMYGQMFSAPMLYPHLGQVGPAQWVAAPQTMRLNPLQLTPRNYEEACEPGVRFAPKSWRDKRQQAATPSSSSSKAELGSGISGGGLGGSGLGSSCSQPFRRHGEFRESSSMDLSTGNSGTESNDRRESDESRDRNTDYAPQLPSAAEDNYKLPKVLSPYRTARRSIEKQESINLEKTDGSSSSSFSSSYFKTDFGSVTESETNKNKSYYKGWSSRARDAKSLNKRLAKTMRPSWMEPILVDFKYQIPSKTLNETLADDSARLAKMEQPSLVNEQLAQLYLELQLDGLPPTLVLDEMVTSSGSSGDETHKPNLNKIRRKCDYSSLVMVYEEDAPLPPPPSGADALPLPLPQPEPVPSTSGLGRSG